MEVNKMVHFGRILKKYLDVYKITQSDFADRLGITQKHMNEIINGNTNISYELMIGISLLTDIDINFIFVVEQKTKLYDSLIKKFGDALFKQESLGGGDIKLMFLIGLVIGYEMSIANIFFATFIAFPVALFLLVTKKDNMIPFGPFLSMAAILLYIWGINFTDIINFIVS
jgi:plasmid maintenance system antidote protein VapI